MSGANLRDAFTVYYDGSCPLCSREIDFYRRRRSAGRLRFVDITRAPATQLGPGLDPASAMRILHARDESGALLRGVDAFLGLWARLPALGWMAVLGRLAPLRWCLQRGYDGFLRWRNRKVGGGSEPCSVCTPASRQPGEEKP